MRDFAKTSYDENTIRAYADKDFIVAYRGSDLRYNSVTEGGVLDAYATGTASSRENEPKGTYYYTLNKMLHRFQHNNRMIGVVEKINDDDSMQIAILGSETLDYRQAKFTGLHYHLMGFHDLDTNDHYNFNPMMTYKDSYNGANLNETVGTIGRLVDDCLSINDIFDYMPQWKNTSGNLPGQGTGFFAYHVKQDGVANFDPEMVLRSDKTHTTHMGYSEANVSFGLSTDDDFRIGHEIYEGMAGDLYDILLNEGIIMANTFKTITPQATFGLSAPFIPYVGTYAQQWKPYNLILTESYVEAQEYLTSGRLPSDAWIYPWNPDVFPTHNPVNPGGEEDDGDDENTPDDNTFNGTPNPPSAPSLTPIMAASNNYYWLQAGQLLAFVDWFWNDVGQIQGIDDILKKVQGLYNDLGSCIVNIRYMPVKPAWIGGLGTSSNIVVGMIEKQGQVPTLAKGKAPILDFGHFEITEKYKSFVDLAPYSTISLYLPLYGFVDLDIDIFNGHSVYVKGVYDMLSGTLQYFIYRDNQFLINSFTAKCAVDIPITLQSKSDRDSAIFSNITSTVGGLIGAGATLATGNPIGIVAGAAALNSGHASAPVRMYGSIGETGAFYAPPECAILIRRPTISKPDNWAHIFGQMCGQKYKLDDLTKKGLTVCRNARIDSFSRTKNSENHVVKPLKDEIEEIYNLLEEGVIL